MNTVERFSNRAANYVRYRPDYPREIMPFLAKNCGLTKDSIIADVGCGPGISSRMFLENGNCVIGVEPNDAMRSSAIEQLSGFHNFKVINGVSDATTLPDASVDLIIAAQAFHWFDPVTTRAEFERILRPGGRIVLIWNERQLDTTPFLIEYEAFLLKYANDYPVVRHEIIEADSIRGFLGDDMETVTFPNVQVFDFEGLKGRMLSASYMPAETDPIYETMIDELRSIFAKHAENGKVNVLYDTNVYTSRL